MRYKTLVPKVTPPLGNFVRYRAVDVGIAIRHAEAALKNSRGRLSHTLEQPLPRS